MCLINYIYLIMKNLSIILLLLISTISAKSQTKKLEMRFGLTLVPQGSFDLKKPDASKPLLNLFTGLTTTKGKSFNVMFYSFSFNSYGMAQGYSFTPKFLSYIVATKSTLIKDEYLGIGFGTPLKDGAATGFIEIGGSSSQKWRPAVYIGMFIPFTFKVR